MVVVGRAYNRNYWSLGVNYRFKTPFGNFSIVFVLPKLLVFINNCAFSFRGDRVRNDEGQFLFHIASKTCHLLLGTKVKKKIIALPHPR